MKKILFSSSTALLLSACANVAPVATDAHSTSSSESATVIARSDTQATADNSANSTVDSFPMPAVTPKAAPPPDDMWEVLRDGYNLDTHKDKPAVNSQIKYYAKHVSYMNRVAKRAEPFLYYISQQLAERNMPQELALLPVVESAYDPFAYSHGRASGMWQFVPETGEHFGLDQNWWYDGRRDVIAATDAALTYLQQLNTRFDGDWELAIAAYNAGGGRVNSAIRKNKRLGKPTDFWSLDLPKETRGYVPKLLALAEITQHPDKYNLKLPKIANKPYLTQVNPGFQIDLATAAGLIEMDETDFRRLNAGFTKWATEPSKYHALVVPVTKKQEFMDAIAVLPKEKRIKFERYKIASGDTLSTIASNNNTSIDAIRAYNPIDGNIIRVGDHLLLPIPAAPLDYYKSSDWQRLARAQKRGNRNGAHYRVNYTVQHGDSLWKISKVQKVAINDIARWNAMAPKDPIRPGQDLVIWKKSKSGTNIKKINYSVRNGDSLARIANKFKVGVNDIVGWNNSVRGVKYIQPGQKLILFVNTNNQS